MQDSENNKGCLLLNFIDGYMHELYTFLTPAFAFIMQINSAPFFDTLELVFEAYAYDDENSCFCRGAPEAGDSAEK